MKIIFYTLAFFAILGCLDRVMGNKLGYGKQFQDGINVTGALVLAMAGILGLSPIISKMIGPLVLYLYNITGIDPSIYVNSFLALDMGGYFLARDLAINKELVDFSGMILGSTLGAAVIFTIPVAFGMIEEDDKKDFAKGVLCGIVTVPLGCLVGGIMLGIKLPFVLYNLIPVIFFSILISLGLWFFPEKVCKGFSVFGKIITGIISIGLALLIIETMLGVKLINGLGSIDEAMSIIIRIALTLAGAFPLLHFINKYFSRQISFLGKIVGLNDAGVSGFMASLVNSIPMFGIFNKMDKSSKIINSAFAVGGSYVFGGQLGFVGGISPEVISAFIVSKLISGLSAIWLAKIIFIKKEIKSERKEYVKTIF